MTNSIKKTNSLTKKLFSIIMAAIMCVSMFAGTTISAQAATIKFTNTVTANVNASCQDYKNVYTNGKAAKLRICTFNQVGKRTSGNLRYLLVSDNGGRWSGTITGCNGISNGTSNLTLPKGNTHYKVYLWRNGSSSKNITNTYYLSIDYMSNCWH